MEASGCDVFLSAVNEQIECAYQDKPINFSFEAKTNSQELKPIQRITWRVHAGCRPVGAGRRRWRRCRNGSRGLC